MHIYIMKIDSIGSQFGIGTYINELLNEMPKRINTNDRVFLVRVFPPVDNSTADISKYENLSIIDVPVPALTPGNDPIDPILGLKEDWLPYISSFLLNTLDDSENIFHFNTPVLLSLAYKLSLIERCKIVYTVHKLIWKLFLNVKIEKFIKITNNPESPIQVQQLIKLLNQEKKLCHIASRIIVISQEAREYVHSFYNIRKEKITLVRNGIKTNASLLPDSKNSLRRKYMFCEQDKIILFVGRIEYEKGIFFLLNTFRKLVSQDSQMRLVLIGDGNYAQTLKFCTKFWTRVTFTGYLPKETIKDFYRLADVGVLPSVNEECGYSALEIVKYQLPLVCSDVGGLSEMFIDGRHVFKAKSYYNDNDILNISEESLQMAIINALSDRKATKEIVKAAYEQLTTQYSNERMVAEILDVYESIGSSGKYFTPTALSLQ